MGSKNKLNYYKYVYRRTLQGFEESGPSRKTKVKPRANGRNIVGSRCYMLRPFAHPVACYCMLLGVAAQCLKPVKL